jgi:hypothetical protein
MASGNLIIAIAAPLITAAVTALGWLVLHVLQQRRDARKGAQEAHSAFLQRQIEELYGPLSNIATQIVVTNHVLFGLIRSSPGNRSKLEEVFYFEYFRPLHLEARNLLKSRLHLVEGEHLPSTFYHYLKASMQEEVQRRLWKEHQVDTSNVKGEPYPDSFTTEVQGTLEALMSRYERLQQGLRTSA